MISYFEQFQTIISSFSPKLNGSTELWLKLGQDQFIRTNFHPSGRFDGYLTKGKGTNRTNDTYIPDVYDYCFQWSLNHDGGVFYIPSRPEGFPLKECCFSSDDLHLEFDSGTLEEQLAKIEDFEEITGLRHSWITTSGSKSIHVHYKLDQDYEIERITYLNRLLCVCMNSDPAVTNPHQPMRISGFFRKEKGNHQQLLSHSSFTYSYEDVLSRLKLYFKEGLRVYIPAEISEARWRKVKRVLQLEGSNKALPILSLPEAEINPPRETYVYNFDNKYDDQIIESCLKYIPSKELGDGRYDEFLPLITALKNLYGETIALSILEKHSPNYPKFEKTIRNVNNSSFDIRVIINLAKSYGWTFPINILREKAQQYYEPIKQLYQEKKGNQLNKSLGELREEFFNNYLNNNLWRELIEQIAAEFERKPVYGSIKVSQTQKELKKFTEQVNKLKENNDKIYWQDRIKHGLENFYKFDEHIVITSDYLTLDLVENSLDKIDIEGKIIGIKSGLGTNKTGTMIELYQYLNAKYSLLQLSDTNNLLAQTVARANELFNLYKKRLFYHLQFDKAFDEIEKDVYNLMLCFQSLKRFINQSFKNVVLVIDESMSVVKSLLDGDTLKTSINQQVIVQIFKRLLRESACIFLLDGNLNNANIDLFHQLSGKEYVKIQCIRETPLNYDLRVFSNFDSLFLQAIDDCKFGKRIAITSDSKAELRTRYQQLLFHGVKRSSIIIVDENSTNSEAPPAFLKNPSLYLRLNPQIKVVMYSPSMNRGFDISGDIGEDFTTLYCLFKGTISIEQMEQQIFRFRSQNMARYLVFEPLPFLTQRDNSYTNNQSKNLLKTTIQLLKRNQKQVNNYSQEIDYLEQKYRQDKLSIYQNQLDELEQILSKDLAFSFITFAQMKGYHVQDLRNDFDDFNDTHEVQKIQEQKKAIKAEIKTNIQLNLEKKANLIAISNSPIEEIKENQETYQQLVDTIKEELNPEMVEHLETLESENPQLYEETINQHLQDNLKSAVTVKMSIEHKLPNFTQSASFTRENIFKLIDHSNPKKSPDELIFKHQRLFYLLNDQLPFEKFEKQLYLFIRDLKISGETFVNSFDRELALIWALKSVGILDLIKVTVGSKESSTADSPLPTSHSPLSTYITNHHPLIQKVIKRARKKKFKDILGDFEKPIPFIRKLLRMLHLDLLQVKRTKGREKYILTPLGATLENLEQSWQLQKDLLTSVELKINSVKTESPDWQKLANIENDAFKIMFPEHNPVSPFIENDLAVNRGGVETEICYKKIDFSHPLTPLDQTNNYLENESILSENNSQSQEVVNHQLPPELMPEFKEGEIVVYRGMVHQLMKVLEGGLIKLSSGIEVAKRAIVKFNFDFHCYLENAHLYFR